MTIKTNLNGDTNTPLNILHIEASGRYQNSVSRELGKQIVAKLTKQYPDTVVVDRDLLTSNVPFINETMIGGYFTPPENQTEAQAASIKVSNEYVEELKAADVLVIGAPIYNFSVPGVLKAYFDLISRAGLTFAYTENGPKGLLNPAKKAFVVVTSGGTPINSDWDFATRYVIHFLNFLGISDVEIITADQTGENTAEKIEAATVQIEKAIA
ncbi:MAG: FMN-dependent NADH-azoreductase [Anaerolineae bacterium]